MDFGTALEHLRKGGAVSRMGWNGKGMFLYLVPGSTFHVEPDRPMAKFWPVGTKVRYRDHIDMKTADGSSVPWIASQTDLLCEDWIAVTPPLPVDIMPDHDIRR